MKRLTALFMTLLTVFSLSAAGQTDSQGKNKISTIIKAYVPTNIDAVPTKALLRYADSVNEAANGRLQVQVYHSGQYGNDREAIEALRLGIIDILFAGTGGFSEFHNDIRILDLPFLFEDSRDAQQKMESELCKKLFSGLEEYNIKYLATGDNGMRHISTSTVPVYTVKDVRSLKIRVPEIDSYVDLWKFWGAEVVPMPLTELNTAMEQGIIQAQDNAPYHSLASGVYKFQHYYSYINYMWMGLSLVANLETWNDLSGELQEILLSEARQTASWTFDEIENDNITAAEIMKEFGILLIYDPDRESFMENIETFYSLYEDKPWFDRALIDALRSENPLK